MSLQKKLLLVAGITLLWFSGIASAQGNETLSALQQAVVPLRDAPELAERLGGVVGATEIVVPPAPAYEQGDRASFFVANEDTETTFEIEAELAAVTPGVYLWVEVGVPYNPNRLADIARQLDEEIFPTVRAAFGQEDSPGIDGDPHIYILNATGLGTTIGGYFNDGSTYPRQIVASSNEHEMFVVAVDNVPFESPYYTYVLAHEFVHMIQHREDPNEETWVTEGTAELGAFLATGPRSSFGEIYLADPTLQLTAWDMDNPVPYYGAASLFFTYLIERYGAAATLAHSLEPANGIAGIDRALAALGATDPATGQPTTFNDLFADWLVANVLNDPSVADGRFGYRSLNLSQTAVAVTYDRYPVALADQQVNQFSGNYLRLESSTPQSLTVALDGSDTVRLVPVEPHSGRFFYWANRADQSSTRLTRAFDLRRVESATLRFWTWYEMESFWDYGYFSVSTDGGATWTVLETPNTTDENPNDRAFAAGITGFSGGNDPRPAPYLGIRYDESTGTVVELVPGGPADVAGIRPADVLTAIGGVAFAPANLLATLDRFHAGETVTITVQRDGKVLDLPVMLGEHPERQIAPSPVWVEETLDLTPFAGSQVLVRFEYVTDQAYTRNGWVIDDISLLEIGYFDDAESDLGGWTAEGWVRVANELPQEFLLEVVQGGTEPTVTRLLMPGEGTGGVWTVQVGPNAPATLILSGMTPYTTEPATFDLTISAGN